MTEANLTKFTLTSEKNGNGLESLVLRKNGNICSCPFRNPTILPHPSIQGQMIIQNPICSDGCQFFEIKEENPVGAVIDLSCSQKPVFIALIEKQKKSDQTRPEGTNLFKI